jgi:hypothetical protein
LAKQRTPLQEKRHAEYLARKERARRLTPYEATHRQGGTAPVFLTGQDQVVTVKVDYATSKRIGRYDNLVRRLVEGRISEAQFDRTTRRWAPIQVQAGSEIPAAKYKFADADTALYLAEMNRALPDRDRMYFDIQGS